MRAGVATSADPLRCPGDGMTSTVPILELKQVANAAYIYSADRMARNFSRRVIGSASIAPVGLRIERGPQCHQPPKRACVPADCFLQGHAAILG